jgi:hypothetical protein
MVAVMAVGVAVGGSSHKTGHNAVAPSSTTSSTLPSYFDLKK